MLRSAHPAPMAFLVSGTLRMAAQMADTQESLGRKVVGGIAWPNSWLPARPHPAQLWPCFPRGSTMCRAQG